MMHLSSPPMTWRNQKNRYMLVSSFCAKCDKLHCPPVKLCHCGSKTEERKMSGNGKILTYTTIHSAPVGFSSPYTVAIIQLEEGPKITGQLVDSEKPVSIGSAVRPVFRRLFALDSSDVIQYSIKFEVVD